MRGVRSALSPAAQSITHPNHHVAGLDQGAGRNAGLEAEFHYCFVGDDRIDEGAARQFDGDLAVDRAFFDLLNRSRQIVAGAEFGAACVSHDDHPRGLDESGDRFSDRQSKRLDAAVGDDGDDAVASFGGDFDFGIDDAINEGGDGAIEYVACASFHSLLLGKW